MRYIISGVVAPAALLLACAVALGGDLAVQIATSNGDDRIFYRDATSHFHVVLINKSSKPLRLWRDANSWGYDALSFRLTRKGQTIEVKRAPTIFTVNVPMAFTLPARGAHVIDVYFGDPDEWEGFEMSEGEAPEVELCADFSVQPSRESHELGVWTGRASSKCRVFILWRAAQAHLRFPATEERKAAARVRG